MVIPKTKSAFFLAVSIIFFLILSFSYTFGSEHALIRTLKTTDKNYYVFLLGFRLRLPEIDKLEFSDNGTFTLTSDMWDKPARGTYEKTTSLIKAAGTTGIFYDMDWEELMEVKYSFSGLTLGIRGFFIIGIGLRDIDYLRDDTPRSEKFIFLGPGF